MTETARNHSKLKICVTLWGFREAYKKLLLYARSHVIKPVGLSRSPSGKFGNFLQNTTFFSKHNFLDVHCSFFPRLTRTRTQKLVACGLRPSANDKYFRVRARMFASDFEPCAVKSSLEKTAFPGRGSVIYPQQKTSILKIARRRRKIFRIWVFPKLGFTDLLSENDVADSIQNLWRATHAQFLTRHAN